jgi:asparagine synthase (glutamine-hydrolysing)
MCGIFGIYNISSTKCFDQVRFVESLLTMKHRGPDANAIKLLEGKILLGHVRLSIIDISDANNQPFNVDDRYWIVYNGEIYNYIELRNDLIKLGHYFKTSGDTEVLIKAYQQWGEECVNRLNGMWAFCIYDSLKNNLFCSRDRFGIKPFNYAIVEDQFIFSSEIKPIIGYFSQLKKPNFNVIANFCRTSTGAQIQETWFENIYRLEPAHFMLISKSGIRKVRYWNYPRKVNKDISFNKAVSIYKDLLTDSVRIRMRSDVPIGFTLSSGIDSTSLVCILKGKYNGNIHTYTAAFSDSEFNKLEKDNYKKGIEFNEPFLVRKLTSELDLIPAIIDIDYKNFLSNMNKIIFHLESGHCSPSVVPLYQIFKEAKKDVTVVLEGQGADELLGGYINNAILIYICELLRKLKFKKAFQEFYIFLKTYSLKMTVMLSVRQSQLKFIKRIYYKFVGLHDFFTGELKKYKPIEDFPNKPDGFNNLLNKHLFTEHTGKLVNLLHYGDAISMAHSLESRLPFMDYRLVEFAFTLPSEYKIDMGMGKIIHRKAMQNIVPDYIINNPVKFGFVTPLCELFKQKGDNSPRSIILSEKCLNRGLFSKWKLIKAFKEQDSGNKNHAYLLYRILLVELWFRTFIDE